MMMMMMSAIMIMLMNVVVLKDTATHANYLFFGCIFPRDEKNIDPCYIMMVDQNLA